MKLKLARRQYTEIETGIELPVYLYFQDELSNDELIMITEEHQIKVKYEYGSLMIQKIFGPPVVEENMYWQNSTTKEHFDEIYNEALKTITT